MDTINSLVIFFYNLIPGALFVIGLDLIFKKQGEMYSRSEASERIVLILLLGIFFGFLFQAISKIFRSKFPCITKCGYEQVIKNDPSTYKKAAGLLTKLENPNKESSLQRNFHLMDNYLRAKSYNGTSENFAAKTAFWSNISIASMGLTIILFFNKTIDERVIYLLLISIFSLFLSWQYWQNQYDVVMKTFIAVIIIDKNNGGETQKSKKI